MNDQIKLLLASYARSFLSAALAVYTIGEMNWKSAIAAGLSAVVPVAIRAINPKDPAFGKIAELAEIEIDKLAKADSKKKTK